MSAFGTVPSKNILGRPCGGHMYSPLPRDSMTFL
jgi:hypothetical protein